VLECTHPATIMMAGLPAEPKEEAALLMQLMKLINWNNSQHLVQWAGLPRPLSGGSLTVVRGLVKNLVESQQNPTEASISLHLAEAVAIANLLVQD
jgi:hypothetical protein